MMAKIQNLKELRALKEKIKDATELREKGSNIENLVQIKVSMATCGIAAGAREIMNLFLEGAKKRHLDNVVVTQTGCMGYCYAEPTVEVTFPGQSPAVYGHVDKAKVEEILEEHVMGGNLVDGVIPEAYKTIND
jgi:NADP-reducing hydrogenase subunit HndB